MGDGNNSEKTPLIKSKAPAYSGRRSKRLGGGSAISDIENVSTECTFVTACADIETETDDSE